MVEGGGEVINFFFIDLENCFVDLVIIIIVLIWFGKGGVVVLFL